MRAAGGDHCLRLLCVAPELLQITQGGQRYAFQHRAVEMRLPMLALQAEELRARVGVFRQPLAGQVGQEQQPSAPGGTSAAISSIC